MAGVAGGAGTSSQPSKMLLAKKIAWPVQGRLVPQKGRITRRRVGFGGTTGQPVSDWSGGPVVESIRQKIGSTVRQTVLSVPPQARAGSSSKWSTTRH